jgi:hypothetical protein
MYMLRTLSFRDLVRAIQHRELRVAGCITGNLIGNTLNTVRADLGRRSHALNRAVRRAS